VSPGDKLSTERGERAGKGKMGTAGCIGRGGGKGDFPAYREKGKKKKKEGSRGVPPTPFLNGKKERGKRVHFFTTHHRGGGKKKKEGETKRGEEKRKGRAPDPH